MPDDELWGAAVAARYDETSADMFAPGVIGPTVDFLADLAGDRPALEFAIGTGRVALPLSERGVAVSGIEFSRAMAAEMAKKPGADRVSVSIGDMASTRVAGSFGLVYLVFNTITNLLTQDEQVACFENAARHLEPGGCFVIEVGLPRLRQLPIGERFVPFDVSPGHVGIDEYDLVEQRSVSHHHWIDGDRVVSFDSPHRYAWPAEYDLMARIARLRLRERWADWDRSPFTSESTSHVSAWELPA